MKKSIFFLSVALLLFSGVCYASWNGIKGSANVIKKQKTSENAIVINESSDQKTVFIEKGKMVKLMLTSNPSTGYSWAYSKSPDKEFLKELSKNFEISSNQIGASGKEVWLFQSTGIGSTEVELKYCRSWETTPPEKTFKVVFSIQ